MIVFGMDSGRGATAHTLAGMPQEVALSFSQDAVAARVNAHATPHVDLTVEHVDVDQKHAVAIVVRQFADYPVICSTDFLAEGRSIVTKGKIYCRSRRMAESTEIQSPDDMRDLLELGTARGIERYFRLRSIETKSSGSSARAQFDDQIRDLGL